MLEYASADLQIAFPNTSISFELRLISTLSKIVVPKLTMFVSSHVSYLCFCLGCVWRVWRDDNSGLPSTLWLL